MNLEKLAARNNPDYMDPIEAAKFDRDISAQMVNAKSEEVKLLKEQLDFIKEQSKSAERASKRMFIIAIGSLTVTALSVVLPLIFTTI